MKIGYSVEGSTDRAPLEGLKRRWCREAELIPGKFRGTSGQSQRREIPNTCIELSAKGADVIVFLRDANTENWREVLKTYGKAWLHPAIYQSRGHPICFHLKSSVH